MWGGDCEEKDEGMGLWRKGCGEGTVTKRMREWDCGERDVGRGL